MRKIAPSDPLCQSLPLFAWADRHRAPNQAQRLVGWKVSSRLEVLPVWAARWHR